MAIASRLHRKLQIHAAHTTIGVGGAAMASRPYFRSTGVEAEPLRADVLRVLVVDRGTDADSRMALALLKQHLCPRYDVQVTNVEPSDVDFDCLVVLGQGLRMAGRWFDLDAAVATKGFEANDVRPMEVEPDAAADGHPVVRGVRPFVSHRGVDWCSGVPSNAHRLLAGTTGGIERPVAWAWHGQRGRAFRTTLGRAGDFEQPDFVRLVLNAIDWVGQYGQRL
jgi:hypothetical protein